MDTIGTIEKVPEVSQTNGNDVIVEDTSRRKLVRAAPWRETRQKVDRSSVARSSSRSCNHQPHPGSVGFSEWLKDMASKPENGTVNSKCAVRGCSHSNLKISGPGSHVCNTCELLVHNLCYQ